MVKRYDAIIQWDLGSDPAAVMAESPSGDWVSFEDYEALRQQVNRLARAYADLTDKQCYNVTKPE